MMQTTVARVARVLHGSITPAPMGLYEESEFSTFFNPPSAALSTSKTLVPKLGAMEQLPTHYVVLLSRRMPKYLMVPFTTEKNLYCTAQLHWWPCGDTSGQRKHIDGKASIWMKPEHIDFLLNGVWCNESTFFSYWAVCNEATKRQMVEEEIESVEVLKI